MTTWIDKKEDINTNMNEIVEIIGYEEEEENTTAIIAQMNEIVSASNYNSEETTELIYRAIEDVHTMNVSKPFDNGEDNKARAYDNRPSSMRDF